ncbi:NAD(P)H-hydrate dehydratase [Paracoccus jiaweipingae]|uniref:NAD(P)H-hydrate dehydratase n=1 Tax=unclassified Paracoccus (in: a-proteobacteria) TaxID=2688777 RepID=UPI00379F7947
MGKPGVIGQAVLTTAEMRAAEAAAMASGHVTGQELMARAGAAVAGAIRLRWPRPGRATVLCGPGNNGGDGYVIARLLAQAGWSVRVLGLDNTPGPDAAQMKARWQATGPIAPLTEAELRRGGASDVYVDAIFGTGLTRPPRGDIAAVLAHLGGRGGDATCYHGRLVAVDCPSGLCLDSGAVLGAARDHAPDAPQARLTVAFDCPKVGHLIGLGPQLCGELVCADIGLGPWREMAAPVWRDGHPVGDAPMGDARPLRLRAMMPPAIADRRIDDGHPPQPRSDFARPTGAASHKYSHGHAVIIGGGPGRGGAARLAARAALRMGAGLVTVCPPTAALAEHAGPPDALMRRGLDGPDDLTSLLADARISALCLGPGCGVGRAAALLPGVLESGRACVLDADALTALAGRAAAFEGLHPRVVLTPHGGEFARLFPDLAARLAGMTSEGPAFSKLDAARQAAARAGAVVLLKGPDTVIAAPDGQAVIHSAFDLAWLATAGAGDVLAGVIAGALARGLPAFAAAADAAWLHAQAARAFGPGLIADDLPDAIPAVYAQLGL